MKPKAIFKRIPDRGAEWFLLNWWTLDGQNIAAPSLGMLIDSARALDASVPCTSSLRREPTPAQ